MNKCENCEQHNNGEYGSGRFCSSKCARGFSTKNKRLEINQKVSNTLKGRGNPNIIKNCILCNNDFIIKHSKRFQLCCSRSCASVLYSNTEKGHLHHVKMGLISSLSQNRRSKNEILFFELCKNVFKNVDCNKPIFNGWDSDIIIHDIKTAVMWNGKWHYEKITKKHSVSQVQNRDKIKTKEIINFGYLPFIIKDMGKYNENFVKEQFHLFILLNK